MRTRGATPQEISLLVLETALNCIEISLIVTGIPLIVVLLEWDWAKESLSCGEIGYLFSLSISWFIQKNVSPAFPFLALWGWFYWSVTQTLYLNLALNFSLTFQLIHIYDKGKSSAGLFGRVLGVWLEPNRTFRLTWGALRGLKKPTF